MPFLYGGCKLKTLLKKEGTLSIRQAVIQDIPAIEAMYKQRVLFNDAHDIHQWNLEEVSWKAFEELYKIDDYYVGECEGTIVCGFFLVDVDELYWKECKKGEALYLHKICVHPEWKGRGYADALIEFFKEKAAYEGYPYARLDVREYKGKLRAMYERHGFTQVAIKKIHADFLTVLYEKKV